MKPEEILEFNKKNKIQYVDLKFNDLPGLWQHFSIPATELTDIDDPTKGIWADGIGFDGSSVRGFQSIQESDMILTLDPETAVVDPICEFPTLSIICDVFDPLTKKAYTRDPRYIAKKADNYLKSTGLADTSYWDQRWNSLFLTISDSLKTSAMDTIILILTKQPGTREEKKIRILATRLDIRKVISQSLRTTHCKTLDRK